MKLYYTLFIGCVILLFSCNKKNDTGNHILNLDNLPLQSFSINIDRDTTLVTKNGCIIKIPKGSLQSDSSNIKLEIKEAITISDIVIAGLTTMSGKKSLGSGGMIYINAAKGYQVNIKKSLEVLVPTKNYNPDMKVYKGEQDDDGKLNWIDPTPLPKDETIIKIEKGEALFKSNCANCHKIYSDFTGPALYGITDRRSKKWIYDFTRNAIGTPVPSSTGPLPGNSTFLKANDGATYEVITDFYKECLFNRWNRTQMTRFQNLNDESLDALYAYIKTESDKRPELAEKYKKTCCDSCDIYNRALYEREFKTDSLISKEEFYNLNRTINIPATENVITPDSLYKNYTQTYYTLNVDELGWHNLDYLLDEFSSCKPSALAAHVNAPNGIYVRTYLIIPSIRVFVQGEPSKETNQFSFDEENGKTALPENAICFIISYGEKDGKILFDKKAFLSKQAQTIELTLAETSESSMKSQIDVMNLSDLQFELGKAPTPDTTLIVFPDSLKANKPVEKPDTLDKFKPKNCDCDYFKMAMVEQDILK
ncbi:MAG: cytochrome c [Ferruginibacter sp.]